MSYTLPRPIDYSKSHYTLYTVAGGKRASLVILGGSQPWGNGLDMTQTYAYKTQALINTHVGVGLGGWVPRYIHYDDLMVGGPTSGGTPSYVPYNGTNQVSGYGAGYNSPSYGTIINPAVPGAATAERSKMDWDNVTGTQPGLYDGGIFGATTYGGNTSPASWRTGGIGLLSGEAGAIRWAVNFTTGSTSYIQIQFRNYASNTIQLQMWGTSNNAGGSPPFWTITDTNWPVSNSNNGYIYVPANSRYTVLIPVTPAGTVTPIMQMGLKWIAGAGVCGVEVLCPLANVLASNHILTQICARNSYCLQDFAPSLTTSSLYGSENVLDLVMKGICNSPYTTPSTNAKPFYMMDNINSMITSAAGSAGDRRLTPSAYANALDAIYQHLQNDPNSTGNGGVPIVCMPVLAQTSLGLLSTSSATAWAGSTTRSTSNNGGTYAWQDYWQALWNLAAARKWGFVDLSHLSNMLTTSTPYWSTCTSYGSAWSAPGTNFYQNDGLHAYDSGTDAIAAALNAQLGLSGGV